MSEIPKDDGPVDRRAVQRTKVLRNAKIIVPARSPVIHCTVQNVTSGGACLKLANTYGVPETFDLTFEHGRTRRPCRVVWRTNDKLGVAFAGEEGAAAPEIDSVPRVTSESPSLTAAQTQRQAQAAHSASENARSSPLRVQADGIKKPASLGSKTPPRRE